MEQFDMRTLVEFILDRWSGDELSVGLIGADLHCCGAVSRLGGAQCLSHAHLSQISSVDRMFVFDVDEYGEVDLHKGWSRPERIGTRAATGAGREPHPLGMLQLERGGVAPLWTAADALDECHLMLLTEEANHRVGYVVGRGGVNRCRVDGATPSWMRREGDAGALALVLARERWLHVVATLNINLQRLGVVAAGATPQVRKVAVDVLRRPWGEVMIGGTAESVRMLLIEPAQRLSLQRHACRDERFLLVAGSADLEFLEHPDTGVLHRTALEPDRMLVVDRGVWHRLCAGVGGARILEVSDGLYDQIRDIERREDDYGRVGLDGSR